MSRYPFLATCTACLHDSDVHSVDDSVNVPITERPPTRCQKCPCPDMVRSPENLADLAVAY